MSLTIFIDIFSDTIMPCLPLGICLYKLVTKYSRVMVILTTYLFISFLAFFLSNYLADRKINNLFIYNLFPIIEEFYFTLIINCLLFKKLQTVGIILFSILSTFFLYKLFGGNAVINYSASITLMADLFIVFLSIICIYMMLDNRISKCSDNNFLFWISFSFLIYASGSFISEAVYALNSGREKAYIINIWLINDVILIIKYLLIGKSITIAGTQGDF